MILILFMYLGPYLLHAGDSIFVRNYFKFLLQSVNLSLIISP
jgi:hypothetical protein